MSKVRRNFSIGEDDDDWLDDKKEIWGVDKSFLVRRALTYYIKQGVYKRDKILKKKIDGEL